MAMVKLLQKLDDEGIFTVEFPRLVTVVCHALTDRAQSARDLARSTLCEVLLTVGPAHAAFVWQSLKDALQRGYQVCSAFDPYPAVVQLT